MRQTKRRFGNTQHAADFRPTPSTKSRTASTRRRRSAYPLTHNEPALAASRYRLLSKKGEGALSIVYRARDTLLDRDVALKVLKSGPGIDAHAEERFDAEARAAASLLHPRIATVYDVIESELGRTIVMEFVNGPSLAERLSVVGSLPQAQAVRYARQIAEALHVAHARGMLHRDVKPGNVLIDAGDQIKVVDFGLVKALDGTAATLTQAGTFVGSAPYVSPEQAQGQALTPASDLYGLGIILYQMMIGSVPFGGDSPLAIALAHVSQPPPSPQALQSAMTPGLAAIVARLLQKDPRRRYASAADVMDALDKLSGSGAHVAAIGEAPTILSPVISAAQPPVGGTAMREFISRVNVPRATIAIGTIVLTALFMALTSPAAIVVGDLRGATAARATSELLRIHLHAFTHSRANSKTAAGIVIAQSPAPGARLHRGADVTLIVSSGPPLVSVPAIRGMTVAQARAALHHLNLVARLGAVYSGAAPYTVVDQAPSPGTRIQPGSSMMVVFSLPPPEAFPQQPGWTGPPRHAKHRGKGHGGED